MMIMKGRIGDCFFLISDDVAWTDPCTVVCLCISFLESPADREVQYGVLVVAVSFVCVYQKFSKNAY